MRIWNFNNGALLRDLLCYDKCELTSIVCSKMLIITGGWNKRISTYVDLVSHVLRHVPPYLLYPVLFQVNQIAFRCKLCIVLFDSAGQRHRVSVDAATQGRHHVAGDVPREHASVGQLQRRHLHLGDHQRPRDVYA